MWWTKKDDDSAKSPGKARTSRESRRRPRSTKNGRGGANGSMDMHLEENDSGIEVSLSDDVNAELPPLSPSQVVIIPQPAKVYRSQFNIAQWPVGPQDEAVESQADSLGDAQLRYAHRVPLFGGSSVSESSKLLFDDVVFLLQSYQLSDERSSIQEELTKLNTEIEALEEDRGALERKKLQLPSSIFRKGAGPEWDVHRMLARKKLTSAERHELMELRGTCLTVALPKKSLEIFVNKCGIKASLLKSAKLTKKSLASELVRIRPDNCRDGGAAATIQHVCLSKGSNDTSFFVSRDNGKAFTWGHLPDRLFRRIKNSGQDPHYTPSDLMYLSTGPMGSYFAEFRSGECWWGSALDDGEFHSICSTWEIYRVVFGGLSTIEDAQGYRHLSATWVILGRDGRAAWKSLPCRLHRKLESRLANEAAPIEIALGAGESYFVRFADGTTDYCLPADAAQACQQIEQEGAAITGIVLHPDVSHDFIIRSTNPM